MKSKLSLLRQLMSDGYRYKGSGLTLIECLVAISVIALTSATIAPVLVLSVATRVQNQKSEQALQLAQGEVDRVRLLVEQLATYDDSDLKLASAAGVTLRGSAGTPQNTAIESVDAPTTKVAKSQWVSDSYSPDELDAKEIDVNADGEPDFVIQAYRSEAVMENDTMPTIFDMGVRVYDYSAMDDPTVLVNPPEEASLGFTSGGGNRRTRPLAILYTQIVNSDTSKSLCDYTEFLQGSTPAEMNCS